MDSNQLVDKMIKEKNSLLSTLKQYAGYYKSSERYMELIQIKSNELSAAFDNQYMLKIGAGLTPAENIIILAKFHEIRESFSKEIEQFVTSGK